jgi:hypothetical protein
MNAKSKTIVDKDGRILLFSVEDFYNEIVQGNKCFICGVSSSLKKFNEEHVLPDWLLSEYDLHNKTVTLPNGANFQYGRYTISCCEECNTLLGNKIEIPVSRLLKLPYSEIYQSIIDNPDNLRLLFNWSMLVFFKTHLKDKDFRWSLDRRKGDEKISDVYAWEEMHHIHCVIRAFYTNAIVDNKVIGSIMVLPALSHPSIGRFDFTDNANGKSIMLRLDEFCIICVLNDSCGAYTLFAENINKIKGALSPFQLREIFSHISYINSNLKERPVFHSRFFENGDYHITADVPEIAQLIDENLREFTFGEVMYCYCKDMIQNNEQGKLILDQIKKGHYTYLYTSEGEFRDYSSCLEK